MLVISRVHECDLSHLDALHSSSVAFIFAIENKISHIIWFPGALAAKLLAITAHANMLQLCLCNNVSDCKTTQH